MNIITPPQARAYVNHGRWVADCPAECGAALRLDPHQNTFHCPECLSITSIEWPQNPDGIWRVLMERPIAKTRNWYPKDHPVALRAHLPHGQSLRQLDEEAKDNGLDRSHDGSRRR